MKWADFCISKISFNTSKSIISEVFVHIDNDTTIGHGEVKDRNWLVQKVKAGHTFCCITKKDNGKWYKLSNFEYTVEKRFLWQGNIPKNSTCHKTFVSYYHRDDQESKIKFENLFGDLFINKCVQDGDINSDNSADYIKQLIQNGYLNDTTILVVLVGPNTKHRKHIDWEISGSLDYRVGDKYSGLIGILLPSHPDYGKTTYNPANLPKRLAANANSGYATIYDWTNNRAKMQEWIQCAYDKRTNDAQKITNKSIPQMQKNTNS